MQAPFSCKIEKRISLWLSEGALLGDREGALLGDASSPQLLHFPCASHQPLEQSAQLDASPDGRAIPQGAAVQSAPQDSPAEYPCATMATISIILIINIWILLIYIGSDIQGDL
jgi:hypothetical protein